LHQMKPKTRKGNETNSVKKNRTRGRGNIGRRQTREYAEAHKQANEMTLGGETEVFRDVKKGRLSPRGRKGERKKSKGNFKRTQGQ